MKDIATDLEINMDRASRMGLDCYHDGKKYHIGNLETDDPWAALELLREIMGGFYES
jgi:hypothetical protein